MPWHNEPHRWRQSGGTLTLRTDPHTDFWQATGYGFVRDNGHFLGEPATGDFRAEVRVAGQYRDLYDQAGLMVRLDAQNWLKCGIEFVEGVQHVSAVATREFSDWSVIPLPDNPPAIHLRLDRKGDGLEVYFSVDGTRFTLARLAYFPPVPEVLVGPMACSPEGEGFEVEFSGLQVGPLPAS